MSPPTEQLIRDYLNRLSVAAQGRLNRDDRRALMDRTRGYIEHSTGLSGPATALEVAGVLSRLGDPALVVAHEVQRLAEIRGAAGEPLPAPRIRRLARAVRRELGRLGASWHWPARPGNLADLHAVLTSKRSGAGGSEAGRPGETDFGARDVTEQGASAGDELAETAGTQAAAMRTADPQIGGTGTTDPQASGTGIAGTPIADMPTAGPVVPEPVSGLEALGLVGRRQDDAGGAQEGPPSNAGPGGFTPAGPGTLAGLIPAQARESASANGVPPEAAVSGRFARAGRPASAAPQGPRWPHDPAIRRDAAGSGRARQDAEDQAGVEAEDQAGVEAEDQAGVEAEDQAGVEAEDQAGVEAEDQADELAVLSAVDLAGEVAERPVVAGLTPEAAQSDARPGADARAESDIGGLSAGGTSDLPADYPTRVDPTGVDLTAVDLSEVDPTAVDLTAVEMEATEGPRPARIRRASAAVVGWTRDKTLESVATILLGLGGVIFPPIWLLGAMVALASKVWDYRDKWVGLAVPIVLTIVGTAAGLILTGSQSSFGHDLHVGWVSADVSSRISAALGAIYLAWRSVRGRRPDAGPPWNKPHRVG
jgi:hypothetical protein